MTHSDKPVSAIFNESQTTEEVLPEDFAKTSSAGIYICNLPGARSR